MKTAGFQDTKRTTACVLCTLFLVFLGSEHLMAQDEDEPPEQARWRAEMAERWNQLRAVELSDGSERELDQVPQALFSFVETTREGGHLGTMWVWGGSGRPAALFVQSRDLREPLWGMELVSLTEDIQVVMHDGWQWTPPGAALTMADFSGTASAAESESGRLVQMRGLARRFDVFEMLGDERAQLRLLPTPVYRYDDESAHVIDGAFFVFAHGTNPEAVLVIECRQQEGETAWAHGFVPLAAAAVTARLNGQDVWVKESTTGPRLQEPYSTWLETEE